MLAFLLAFATVWAGCAGGGKNPDGDDTEQDGDDTEQDGGAVEYGRNDGKSARAISFLGRTALRIL